MKKHLFTNTYSGAKIEMGTKIRPYALSETKIDPIPATHNTTAYLNLDGEHLNSSRFNPRPVSFTGWIFAENEAEMETRKTYLNRFFNPRQQISVQYDDTFELFFHPNSSVQYATNKYDNRAAICKWMIQGTAHYPFWRLIDAVVIRTSEPMGVPLFPMIIPATTGRVWGIIHKESAHNANNFGDVDIGFVIQIIAKHGPVTNPKITNNKTGEFIELIVSLNMGDMVEISTETGNKFIKLIKEGVEADIFTVMTKTSTASMVLNPGENNYSISAAGNASNIAPIFKYKPAFIEVQR